MLPWCISCTALKVPTVREETTKFSIKYRDKITHPNELASTLREEEEEEEEEPRRLKRFRPRDLTTRFS
jgi:hypothetical protein